jgi:hypothetical protein
MYHDDAPLILVLDKIELVKVLSFLPPAICTVEIYYCSQYTWQEKNVISTVLLPFLCLDFDIPQRD